MKLGTPGFEGIRLREARQARGLTMTSLADLVDVSRQTISNYENDKHTPQPEVLKDLASTLKVPPTFFLQSAEEKTHNTIFFRSLASATKQARNRAIRQYEWLQRIVDYLGQFLEFPEVRVPRLSENERWKGLEQGRIEELAEQCRSDWGIGLGPISNVVLLLENNGVVIGRNELGSERLDAFSEWGMADGRPYIVLGADKNNAFRSRFDVAHELAHLVLHRQVKKREHSLQREFRLIEKQANRFAGAFLLPAESFTQDFLKPNLHVFQVLKKKWKTSIAMMIYRCKDLGILSEEGAQKMWVQYSRKGYKKREPLDAEYPPEAPRLLTRSIQMLIDQGVQTRREVLDAVNLRDRDIEKLTGLSKGYLSKERSAQEPTLRWRTGNSKQPRQDDDTNIYSLNS